MSSNPAPTITAISPNTAAWNGPAFTLTVNGSGFVSGSTVLWNGYPRTTTFVSSSELTAQIPATDTLAAGTQAITATNLSGTSSSLPLTVPCVLASPGPASTQTVARLGAYYFDGWSGPLTNFHFNGMLNGAYQGREPLSGWRDNTSCAVEQQLAWAHEFGLNYFVFDWYYDVAQNEYEGDNLNNALQTTLSLPNRHGMQFAIQYVDAPPFVVPSDAWTSTITQWLGYMSDPDYVRVNGKPLLVVYSMGLLEQSFTSTAIADSFNQLRAAAQAQGLPGVYIVGGLDVSYDPLTQALNINDLSMSAADGYDAYSMYNYSTTGVSGSQAFSMLQGGMEAIWTYVAQNSPLPHIPVAVDGQDARPTNEWPYWFSRSPQDVSGFVSAAINWAQTNPSLRPEPPPSPPLVLIEAWNELGEDGILVPTVGDGTTYGDSLATMLTGQADNQANVEPFVPDPTATKVDPTATSRSRCDLRFRKHSPVVTLGETQVVTQ